MKMTYETAMMISIGVMNYYEPVGGDEKVSRPLTDAEKAWLTPLTGETEPDEIADYFESAEWRVFANNSDWRLFVDADGVAVLVDLTDKVAYWLDNEGSVGYPPNTEMKPLDSLPPL